MTILPFFKKIANDNLNRYRPALLKSALDAINRLPTTVSLEVYKSTAEIALYGALGSVAAKLPPFSGVILAGVFSAVITQVEAAAFQEVNTDSYKAALVYSVTKVIQGARF